MIRKKLCLAAAIFFSLSFCPLLSYALPWKTLHEKADHENQTNALAEVVKNPNSTEVLYTLGLVYLNSHKINEADGVFLDILQLDPKCTEAKWGHAEVLRRRYKMDQARIILEEILKKDPGFSPATITLSYLLYQKHDYDGAIRLAAKVIRQGHRKVDLSNFVRAYLVLAGSRGMIAQDGWFISTVVNGLQVLPNLNKAEKLQPDSAEVAFGLGSYYLLAPSFAGGDKSKALDYLEKAIKRDPLFADAYARLAELYQEKGAHQEYLLYLTTALQLDPQNDLALEVKKMYKT